MLSLDCSSTECRTCHSALRTLLSQSSPPNGPLATADPEDTAEAFHLSAGVCAHPESGESERGGRRTSVAR